MFILLNKSSFEDIANEDIDKRDIANEDIDKKDKIKKNKSKKIPNKSSSEDIANEETITNEIVNGEKPIKENDTDKKVKKNKAKMIFKTSVNNTEEPEENNRPKLKPLIKWSGGKSDEIKMFENHIPKDYNIYLEPFIGGGSVFFNQNPKKAVISDVHKELVDFYKSIKKGKANKIHRFMSDNPNDEELYYKVRDEMNIKTSLDNAKRFYYLRKTCFRGMMRYNKDGKFNIPYGKYKKINYDDLLNEDYEKIFENTEIFNQSYEYIFENYNDENNFMFLDPPYDSEFTDYGYCKFDREEQKKLAKCFKETKIKCLMIIGKTSFISELYKDYIVGEYNKNYRFKLYGGRVGDEINTKHLIIKNYK